MIIDLYFKSISPSFIFINPIIKLEEKFASFLITVARSVLNFYVLLTFTHWPLKSCFNMFINLWFCQQFAIEIYVLAFQTENLSLKSILIEIYILYESQSIHKSPNLFSIIYFFEFFLIKLIIIVFLYNS